MREIPNEKILIYVSCVVLLAACMPLLHRMKRNRGKNIIWHIIYAITVIITLLLLPEYIQNEIFSPGGVLIIGTIIPIYESIVAICTIGEEDDKAWLQFWITSATLSFSTEFMDEIKQVLPSAGEHWYEFEFIFNLWLLLPITDGATLIFDIFTKPYISPIATKIAAQCEGYIAIIFAAVNTSYLWFVWWAFMTLPEDARRFVVIVLGTVYPIAASTVAIATTTNNNDNNNNKLDETKWLTYWSTFSILFIAMDYIENFIGHIRGFYSICAIATLYLFLPMFNGAEVVFRNILVPLSGQYENLLLHDAYLIKIGMENKLPIEHRERVLQKTAYIFSSSKGKAE